MEESREHEMLDTRRYERQISLDGFGIEGQKKLEAAEVAVVGVGGLGSAVSMYLAAAGIGTLRLIDPDTVELSNLNRQILHWQDDIERPKVDSARTKLSGFNEEVRIVTIAERLDEDNAERLLHGCSVIVDCLDNFTGRYVLNRTALELGIPLVHGACQGLEGRCTTIIPGRTPCFRCLYPAAPPERSVPILGSVAGTVGTIQATETVKYITGMGELLAGRLLLYDGGGMSFHLVEITSNAGCPDCGIEMIDQPSVSG